jgi:hypothetical protein
MRGKALKIAGLAVLVLALAALPAVAQEPTKVSVGVFVNQIYDMSLKDNQYSVDFWVWFRYKDKEINPIESFEVVGGRVDSVKPNETLYNKEAGEYYASARVNATITKFWNILMYPLDNHVLEIVIEDNANDASSFVFVPDSQNCSLEQSVQVPGWQIGKIKAEVGDHTYNSNYGDPSLPPGNPSVYSRFTFSVDINRQGVGFFLKMFFTVFIATLIALMTLIIRPTDLDPRFGLSAGALFAAVASEMVIAANLPDTNLITLADRLHIVAIFFIFASIAESVVSLHFANNDKVALARKIDKFCLFGFLAVYLIISAACVIIR